MSKWNFTAVAVLCGVLLCCAGLSFGTPLDDYVNAPDPNFSWTDLEEQIQGDGWKGYVLNMTSQKWLTRNDWAHNARPEAENLWWHKMIYIIPDTFDRSRADKAIVWITGGNNNNPESIPDGKGQDAILMGAVCVATGLRGLVLHQIPNQPIFFRDEQPQPKSRTEDALIAYTWDHFIHKDPNDPEWLARFPMTKAVVRAMDAMTEFSRTPKAGGIATEKYIVAGASKRGWTTWTTAAVDKRVIAFAPLVMDLLNVIKNTHHHFRALGGWSFAFGNYWEMEITANLDHPNTKELEKLVDGFHYRDRYAGRPALMVVASGDQFFLTDDSHYFWSQMPKPEMRMLMLPNAEHSMITAIPQAVNAISAFANAVCEDFQQPIFEWSFDPATGDIRVQNFPQHSGDLGRPIKVEKWFAQSAENTGLRDWRLMAGNPPELQLVLWSNETLTESSTRNVWIAKMPQPAPNHWMAMFVRLQFSGPADPTGKRTILDYTTEASIWPTSLPFPQCSGQDCKGILV